LAAEPPARAWLRRPGPYLAAAVGLAAFSPVVAWNATHGWASFAFQGGRALGEARLRPDTFAAALLGPAVYLFPWVWARLVRLLVGRGRRFFDADTPAADRFLLSQAVGPLATFLAVACSRPVLPHWTLVGFLPLYPMLGRSWEGLATADPFGFRRRLVVLAAVPTALATLAVVHAHTGVFQKGRLGGIGLVRVSRDPTADMYGWDRVAGEIERRGLLDRPGTFLFTSSWYHSGQLGFATRGSAVPVLCYHAWDARSFAFWSRPEEWVGRDGILVAVNERPADFERFANWFSRIEPLGAFEVTRGGAPVRKVGLFRCVRQTVAFPFDDLGRNVRPRRGGGDAPVRRVADGSQVVPDAEAVR
jgi:hypothetical protein